MALSNDARERLKYAMTSASASKEVADAVDAATTADAADAALASGLFIVGSAGGVATDVAMSGDATLANTGAVTLTPTSANALATPSPTTNLGFLAGAGGAVTQGTSKSTGVTLSKPSGAITLNNAALGADTIASFVLTNTLIGANDVLLLNHISGGTPGKYHFNARCAAGSATIDVVNISAGSLSEAPVLQFVLVKGAVA